MTPARAAGIGRSPTAALVLVFVALVVLAVASGRPIHIDGALNVAWAREIAQHWSQPYAGELNWHGMTEPIVSAVRNPPLIGWVLAVVGPLTGWSERVFHLLQLVPAGLFLWGTWILATRWSTRPLVALAIVATSPVFLLCSGTVMADVPLAAAWVLAVVAWCKPPAKGSSAWAAFFVSLAVLTKWFGLAVIPLLVAWEIAVHRRFTLRCTWLLLPIVVVLLLEAWVRAHSGVSILSHIAHAAVSGDSPGLDPVTGAAVGLAFFGGAAAGTLLLLPWMIRRFPRASIAAVAAALLVTFVVHGALDRWPHLQAIGQGRRWLVAIQAGLWASVGVGLLMLGVSAVRDTRPESRFMAAWIAGVFVFAAFLDWTILARSFLPALPVVGILLANALDGVQAFAKRGSRTVLVASLVASACFSLLLFRADAEVSVEARDGARKLAVARDGGRVWFQGHWGFQHYAEVAGAKAMDRENVGAAKRGDVILIPMLNTNVFGVNQAMTRTLEHRRVRLRSPFVVLGPRSGAGFWSATLGPLPFAWNLGDVSETWAFEQQ